MQHRTLRAALALLLIATFTLNPLAAVRTRARAPQPPQQQESKDERKLREAQEKQQKQEQERKAREEKNRANQLKQYTRLSDFARDQYGTDPEFRDDVDKAYLDLQAQHALQAYRINTARQTELVSAESEDQSLVIRRVLYDNPWVQDYVNRVGQRMVPADSDKLYAFKVAYHPIPYAYTLSTGTILISTGMISLLDNEAQLAYVLGHELGHVYKDHWKLKVMMPLAENDFNLKQERKRAVWTGLAALAGAAAGGIAKGAEGTLAGAMIGGVAGYAVGAIFNRKIGVDWETVQENEADDFALKTTLEKSYDTQEVPKLYQAMENVARFDGRVQLGFLGQRARLKERREHYDRSMQGALQTSYQELQKAGKLVGGSPEFNRVMAELKRDNGIEAYRFDMFQMARTNLQQAVQLRSDDARASFYYGRVLKQVGRTPEELNQAQQYLLTSIRLDAVRLNIPEAHLQKALMLMDQPDDASRRQAIASLQEYISVYEKRRVEQGAYTGALPANVDVLYDFMRVLGEKDWKPMPPQMIKVEWKPTAAPITPAVTPVNQPAASQSTSTGAATPAGKATETKTKGRRQ